jgi:hypothetical protein
LSSSLVPSNNLTDYLNISYSLNSPSIPSSIPSILAPDLPVIDSLPPLRRSSRLHFTTSRAAIRDGLLPDSRLAAAISNVAASAAHIRAIRDDGPVDSVHAFLAEFLPFCNSHNLLPLNVAFTDATSVPDFVTAIADGSLEPDLEDEPKWHEALQLPEREYWIMGGHDEVCSLQKLKVFILVPHSKVPRGAHSLKGKLVCKWKRDNTGKVVCYKVCYVTKGYVQQYGMNYNKTITPTACLESFRTITHLAAALDWDLIQYDIKMVFLYSVLPLDETIFIE